MPEVISRREIGSANPVAKFFRGLADSIKGVATGFFFIIISFVLVYNMVTQKEHSKTIEALPLQTPEEVVGVNGMVKIEGMPEYTRLMVEPLSGKEVLYYSYVKEDYAVRRIENTRVVEENGKQIEETIVDYREEWKPVSGASKTEWSEFKLGQIEIDPGNADDRFNDTELYKNEFNNPEFDANSAAFVDKSRLVDKSQKFRETVRGVLADTKLVVVGENSNNRISSGVEGAFFVSNMSASELLGDVQSSEKMWFWIMAIGAWFLMAQGFTMLLGPVTHMMNVIPGLGSMTRGLLFGIFAIISAVIVFLAYIGLKFWWGILIAVLVVFGFIIFRKSGSVPAESTPAEKKE